jgi:hypothetical protein
MKKYYAWHYRGNDSITFMAEFKQHSVKVKIGKIYAMKKTKSSVDYGFWISKTIVDIKRKSGVSSIFEVEILGELTIDPDFSYFFQTDKLKILRQIQ